MSTFHEEPALKKARPITVSECDDLVMTTHLKELSKDDLVSYILYLRSGVDESDATSKVMARYQNGSLLLLFLFLLLFLLLLLLLLLPRI
jgi:hypothetical protein